MESKKDNLKGHFESHDFVRLSNNILKSINSNWHFSINPKFCKELGGDIDCQYEGNIDYPVDDLYKISLCWSGDKDTVNKYKTIKESIDKNAKYFFENGCLIK